MTVGLAGRGIGRLTFNATRKPAFICSGAVRRASTTTRPDPGSAGFRSRSLLAALTLTGLSAIAGYYVGNRGKQSNTKTVDQVKEKSLGDILPSFGVSGERQPVRLNSTYGTPEEYQKAIKELRSALSDDLVSIDPDVLHNHGFSMNDYHPASPHTVVVFPNNTEDVVQIVNISRKYKMPIVPYAGGTGLEGNCSGVPGGGICLDMCNMNKIIEINEADGDLICQAGIGWVEINEVLKDKGINMFFPLDPSPQAAIGGMMSTGCSGTNAVRYGTAKAEWFLNCTVVLPSGEVIKTRRRSRKSSAGFDLTKLFIGAEGTLGIITEATLRLAPLLETRVAVCQFPTLHDAAAAVRAVLASGVPLQCIELVDERYLSAANKYGASSRKWREEPGLFIKFQGSEPIIEAAAGEVQEIVKGFGGNNWAFAMDKAEGEELWLDRKNGLYIGLSMRPGARGVSTDVCVPLSKLPQIVRETKEDLDRMGITYNVVGHAGDGNFHTLLLFADEEELAKVKKASGRMVERALEMDGTCTGEHGVGIGKRKYLYEELGEGTVELMKSIKQLIDPYNLLNPGKLYPADLPARKKSP